MSIVFACLSCSAATLLAGVIAWLALPERPFTRRQAALLAAPLVVFVVLEGTFKLWDKPATFGFIEIMVPAFVAGLGARVIVELFVRIAGRLSSAQGLAVWLGAFTLDCALAGCLWFAWPKPPRMSLF